MEPNPRKYLIISCIILGLSVWIVFGGMLPGLFEFGEEKNSRAPISLTEPLLGQQESGDNGFQIARGSHATSRIAKDWFHYVSFYSTTKDLGVPGRVVAIRVTAKLISALQNNLLITPIELRRMTDVCQSPLVGNHAEIQLWSKDSWFYWLEVPGATCFGGFINPTETIIELPKVVKCSPFSIKVFSEQGVPLKGVSVGVFSSTKNYQYHELSWEERLAERFFFLTGSTGSDGIWTIPYFPETDAFAWASPGQGNGFVSLDGLSAKGEIELRLTKVMSATGLVEDGAGNPIPDVAVVFFVEGEEGTEAVAEVTSDESGKFEASSVSCDGHGIVAMAYKKGYSSQVLPLQSPIPGASEFLHFTLSEAAKGRWKLEYPDGSPGSNLECQFATSEFDWIPYYYQTDSLGSFESEEVLNSTGSVFLRIWNDDAFLCTVQVDPSGMDESVLVLPGVGRFDEGGRGWNSSIFRLYHPSGDISDWRWTREEEMPFVPTGSWLLESLESNGEFHCQKVVIQTGVSSWPEKEIQSAFVSWDNLDRNMGAIGWRYGNRNGGEFPCVPGFEELEVSGPFPTLIYWKNDQGVEVPLSEVHSGDQVFLGALGNQSAGTIECLAMRTDGTPIPDCHVLLVETIGQSQLNAVTDDLGKCHFLNVPLGSYQVSAFPSAFQLTWVPSASSSIEVLPGQWNPDVVFVFGGDTSVEVNCSQYDLAASSISIITGDRIRSGSPNSSGVFKISVSEIPNYAVCTELGDFHVRLNSSEFMNEGTKLNLLPSDGKTIEIESPENSESGGSVAIYSEEFHFLRRFSIKPGRKWVIENSSSHNFLFQYSGERGSGAMVSWDELLAGFKLSGPSLVDLGDIEVTDLSGGMPSSVIAVFEGMQRSVRLTNSVLRIEAWMINQRMLIMAPGFWPTEVPVISGAIALRGVSGEVRIELPMGISAARIVPQFKSPGGDFEFGKFSLGQRLGFAGKLPEGQYSIVGEERSVRLIIGDFSAVKGQPLELEF